MEIAFLGLGIMGSGMAKNLVKHGHNVTVWNRSKEKMQEFQNIANSPKDAVKNKEIVITMLANPQAVEDVALGQDGFLNHLNKGAIWIDCSTVSLDCTKKMDEESKKRNITFIDAPVGGSKPAANEGKLVFIVGANKENLETITPILNCMGQRIIHAGDTGKGITLKLVNNLIVGSSMLALAEAIALGEKMGLNKNELIEIIKSVPVSSVFMQNKAERIKTNNYEAEFPLELMHKDMELIVKEAKKLNLHLEGALATKDAFEKSKFKREDLSAIYKDIK